MAGSQGGGRSGGSPQAGMRGGRGLRTPPGGGGPWQGTKKWLLKVNAGTQEDPHPAAWNCKANILVPLECGEPSLHPPKVAAMSWIKAEPGEFRDIEGFVLALPHPGCATWIKVSQPL